MKADHWKRLKGVFESALEKDPKERLAFLDEACKEDPAFRAEVEALLAADTSAQDFLKSPITTGPSVTEPIRSLVGARVGQYKLTRMISSGGMGTVYEALQEQPRRIVAIKVMKGGIASPSMLRRFEYESQILARLRHPGIAHVIEAGTHVAEEEKGREGAGVPYFVMEYIEGARPITVYARERKLKTRERMNLFLQVCEAVHHGHQKGVIHRDLKPGNILVDAAGRVKVIDFGVARATDSDMALTTMQTDVGQLIGTVQYMSPEQCGADPRDLDTRSDVYALGVVLYELLCERLPYDVRKVAVFEATRRIREEEPKRPSTVDRALRGDIETIVLKTLEKDPKRRYQSVADFSEDLRRVQRGDVILAKPAGPAIRFYKQIKRNPVLSATVTVALAALLSFFLYVVLWSYPQIKAERDRAEREAERTETINRFLNNMLASPDPAKDGRAVRVVDVLDQAAKEIEGSLENDPVIEASLRSTIGWTYYTLGVYDAAEPHLKAALDIRVHTLGPGNRLTINAMNNYAMLLGDQGKLAEAESMQRRILEVSTRVLGEDHYQTLGTLNNLAWLLQIQGKLDEAEVLNREVCEISRRTLGEEAAPTLKSMNNLGSVLGDQGKPAEAEVILREVLEISNRTLGETHPDTLKTLNNLACALQDLERLDESEAIHRDVLKISRRALGDKHQDTLGSFINLGILLQVKGELKEAEALMREALTLCHESLGDAHPKMGEILFILAGVLLAQGNYSEAESYYAKLLVLADKMPRLDDLKRANYYMDFGNCLLRQQKYSEAEVQVFKGYETYKNVLGADDPITLQVVGFLIFLYERWGKPDEAAQWREKKQTLEKESG